MTDLEKRNGSGAGNMTGAEEMDRLFRETDFAAENPGLRPEQLWQKFQEKAGMRRESIIENGVLSQEILEKAMQCDTAAGLMALARSYGKTITRKEAEAYLAELDDCELDADLLKNVAGGGDSYKTCSGKDE